MQPIAEDDIQAAQTLLRLSWLEALTAIWHRMGQGDRRAAPQLLSGSPWGEWATAAWQCTLAHEADQTFEGTHFFQNSFWVCFRFRITFCYGWSLLGK